MRGIHDKAKGSHHRIDPDRFHDTVPKKRRNYRQYSAVPYCWLSATKTDFHSVDESYVMRVLSHDVIAQIFTTVLL